MKQITQEQIKSIQDLIEGMDIIQNQNNIDITKLEYEQFEQWVNVLLWFKADIDANYDLLKYTERNKLDWKKTTVAGFDRDFDAMNIEISILKEYVKDKLKAYDSKCWSYKIYSWMIESWTNRTL